MSTRRRSRSRDKKNIPAKLRMDTKPQTPRITDPSLPAGRRREIDNVMKKARAQTSPTSGAFWDKKLLEVEAKDPNRWRHSGYKSLYIDGSSSPSSGRRSRSRSAAGRRSRSRSPSGRRSPRSPPYARRSPRSPPPRRSSPPPSRRSPPSYRPSPLSGRRTPRPVRPRSPPSPAQASASRHKPPPRRSASASSISSCSDDSCSVCSPKAHRGARSRSRSFSPQRSRKPVKVISPPPKAVARARPPSPSLPPRRMPRPMTPPPAKRISSRPSPSDRPTDPRRQPPPPRPRGSTGEIINVRGVKPPAKPGAIKKPAEKGPVQPMLLKRIKKERTGKRPGSPGAESSGSEDSSSGVAKPIVATTGLTLSERFGKIAQWSADRERRDIENMRITKTGSNMKVMVEEDDFLYGSPPRSLSPIPSGHFPDELLSSGQSRQAAWDDVRVRYQYYKDLGYLRDLTLDDYIKWEEWWYKYQDWLANERHYEHWLSSQSSGRRRGKKRIPATQRLN
ncbi:serine/arginine repetitive matrix protein 1 isoform X2 [Anoplophora glabripennis]|uniref:serine/arginine repetitive matrix protein 1 isoform X2 n=1 Tax=Anoplophora glabripennis TaxID=217634 RepID=UPI000874A612|nr:serine/arginine repetitive matrix protein 1 isoform X2 [Anoplophora glabripennis]